MRRTAEGLLIGVWDQGHGIPADKLPTIFHEFQRLPEHRAMCSTVMPFGSAVALAWVPALSRSTSQAALALPYGTTTTP